ncbi:MAG: ABC transporter permease [Thiobacillus sp.]|nr:ABC transporter permease [Thiobacillus sp.]
MKSAEKTLETPIMNQPVVKNPKIRLPRINWRGVIAIIGFFVAWHLSVKLGFPGFREIAAPYDVLHTFLTRYLDNPDYWASWVASFKRVLYGFLIAQLLGIPLGLLLGTRQTFNHLVYPVIEIMRPIPPLAWVPISILFWPTTESSIIFITFIGAFFIIVINVHDAVKSIKKEHIWLAQSLGASSGQIFRRIMIPSVIPSIAVGMTLGIAVTWNVVIAAEMISGDNGLGRLTWEGYVSHTVTVVIIGMVSIGLAGYLSTIVVDYLEKKMMPWRVAR